VRARCESEDEHAGLWVAKGRNRAAPVFPVAIGAAFERCDLKAVLAQPRAAIAVYDLLLDLKDV
jgi:hypothetical protein